MSFNSAIYSGTLHHRRLAPKFHQFRYRVTFYYIDLSETERIFNRPFLFSHKLPFLFGFNRKNYLAGAESLKDTVHDLILVKTEKSHHGPVRMLSQITYWGFCFNPVTFFYCFDPSDSYLEFIVVEITNTPWKERKSYVFACNPQETQHEFQFEKDFHVSPFFPMNLHYNWKFKTPTPSDRGSFLNVFMEDWNEDKSQCVFFANLNLISKPLNGWNIFVNLISFPVMTIKTVASIYFQSLLLLIKRVPFYTHPDKKVPPNGD
ncbi:MAG: DUF1365 domain-containing protein [Bdellovibrionaceae bacterium]|nr:DUF1365 domain-containing protein [Pseudobdellovibrionaceae bacterium]